MWRKFLYLIFIGFVLGLMGSVALTAPIAAEVLLVELRAKDLPYGTAVSTWPNNGSLVGNFTARGTPIVEDVDGVKAVTFDGSSWFEGPTTTAGIESDGDRSIEVWAYNPSMPGEETMVSWGHRGGPGGSDMAFNYGNDTSWGAVTHWGGGTHDMGWWGNHAPAPAANTWWHLVYTYDGTAVRVYVNGEEESVRDPLALSTHSGNIIRIAAQADDTGEDVAALFNFTGSIALVRIYDRALTQEEIRQLMIMAPELASNPSPVDEATDVPRGIILGWTPGEFADKHDVYLSTMFDKVNEASRNNQLDVLVSQSQDMNSYIPIHLEFGQTYYWRIDEVNSPPDETVYKGDIWSFTMEPFAYTVPGQKIEARASSQAPNQGPEKTIDGSGLDINDLHSTELTDMWLSEAGEPGSAWIQYDFDKVYKLHQMLVWNYNAPSFLSVFGIEEVTVEYSADGTNWIKYCECDISEFTQATGEEGYAYNTIVDFGGVAVESVKITANNNWVGGGGFFNQYGLSEVRFLYIPVQAIEESPESDATDVSIDVILDWKAGREAAEHNVYLGTDEQAVINGTAPATIVSQSSYSPSTLDLESTYFWRVDEVNIAETPAIWQGDIWSFSTQEYLIVDDFESYNDIPAGEEGSNVVYETWIDGYTNPSTNGSTIGYVAGASMETDIVHNGNQSVPLMYDNSTASISEVTVNISDLAIGSDWTKGSAKALVLWFYGDRNNAATEQMYVKIDGNKVVYDGDPKRIAIQYWHQWSIDLASLGVSLNNVTTLTIGFERTSATGGSGVVFIDDIGLYRIPPSAIEPVDPGNANLVHSYTFEDGTANDGIGTAHGTLVGGAVIANGALVISAQDQWMEMPGGVIAMNTYGEVTIEAWYTPEEEANTDWSMLAYFGDSVGGLGSNGYFMTSARLNDMSRAAISIGDIATPWASESGVDGPEYDDGLLHHMVSTLNATDITLYIDGVLIGETPLDPHNSISGISQNFAYLAKGGYEGNLEWIGSIEEFNIYNRALSDAEILNLYFTTP